uniref:C2H2-type domain-containing protein n=1 Tax=Anopheles maculatus TaxID=74869 RepID=A0A182SBG3_9DIPT
IVDKQDTSPSASSSTSTDKNRSSSCSSASSSEEEPPKTNSRNRKNTPRTRRKKFQPDRSPASEEDEQEDDFLQSVTLKSLTEKFQYEKPHKCSRKGCPYKFASFDIRDQHLRCHAESDSIPDSSEGSSKTTVPRKRFSFKCSQCDGKFDSWKPCLLHVWREHQIDLGMLRCPMCEKRYVYAVHVFKHLQTHRQKQTLDVPCRVCGKKFVNTSQRSVHEALHRKKESHGEESHGEEDELEENEKPRWYSERRCDICKHMFSNSKILSKHIKTVHLKIKPFVCNVCGYKCARKATLNIHIRQHSGLKPLTCKSCTFRTADPSALSYHERRHRNEKAYQCKTCGIRLVQPSALRGHIQTQHPQEYQRMKCTLCDYASINPQNLKQHQANHKAGLIKTNDEDSQMDCDNDRREQNHRTQLGMSATGNERQPVNAPEISFDCFLPLESVDSVVHDTGGITIPAALISLPAALSEETQFPI